MSDDVLRVVAMTIACLFGLWTAVACRRAQYHGLPGSDALIWAGLSGAFFLLSLMKTARGLGLLRGFGGFLRDIFKQRGWYEDRRSLQIAASIAIAVVVIALIVWGLLWAWHYIKRYRLAIGFMGLTLGFAIIRFISLHEVDAWNANAPWARTAVDLVAAAGVSAVAIARLWQLRDFYGLGTSDPAGGDDPHVSAQSRQLLINGLRRGLVRLPYWVGMAACRPWRLRAIPTAPFSYCGLGGQALRSAPER